MRFKIFLEVLASLCHFNGINSQSKRKLNCKCQQFHFDTFKINFDQFQVSRSRDESDGYIWITLIRKPLQEKENNALLQWLRLSIQTSNQLNEHTIKSLKIGAQWTHPIPLNANGKWNWTLFSYKIRLKVAPSSKNTALILKGSKIGYHFFEIQASGTYHYSFVWNIRNIWINFLLVYLQIQCRWIYG